MGDHTDYNDGFVLPLAIDRGARSRPLRPTPRRGGGHVRASCRGRVVVPSTAATDPRTVEPSWGRFVAGAVRALTGAGAARHPGRADDQFDRAGRFRPVVELGVVGRARPRARRRRRRRSTASTWRALAFDRRDRGHRRARRPHGPARVALRPRRARAADRLPRRSRSTPVAIPPAIAVVVVHCGVPRTLVGSEYACRAAPSAKRSRPALGIASLRDATPEQVADQPRARHVVSENARVLATAAALPRATSRCSGRSCSRATPACATTTRCRPPSSTCSSSSSCECGAAGARLTGAGLRRLRRRARAAQPRRRRPREDDAALPRRDRHRADGLRGARRRRRAPTRLTRRTPPSLHPAEELRLLLLELGGGDVTRRRAACASCSICSGTAAPGCARRRRPRAPAAPWPPACCGDSICR